MSYKRQSTFPWIRLFMPHKKACAGLPWWHSGWESACQCRAHGFEPWSGKIPHAAEQLGPWATTTEPARLEPVLRNERGRDSERPVHRNEEWPLLATTRESPSTETKTQHSNQAINQSIKLKKKKACAIRITEVPLLTNFHLWTFPDPNGATLQSKGTAIWFLPTDGDGSCSLSL